MSRVTTGRRRMSAAQRREQILDVTRSIVLDEGFHEVTPGRIAAGAGVDRSLVYQQFGDLAGLFVALIDREITIAGEGFAAAVAAAADQPERPTFDTVFDGVLAAIDENPSAWRLFLSPPQGAPPELHARLAESTKLVRGFLQDELERLNPDLEDPELTALALHAAGSELLHQHVVNPTAVTADRLRAFIPAAIARRSGR
ncbi:TetR/AcrR family transcriptional regulator [Gordonia malaquae]|nr:TetR/AcrR family transcriptional regulator [Gordonia malaquae]